MITLSSRASPAIIVTGVVLIIIASAVLLIISKFQATAPLYLGAGVFDSQIAYTEAARAKGYAGVDTIPDNQALILAFPRQDKWKISVKDMSVPIDIVWLNNNKKVVYVIKNASPDSGINTVFTPKEIARYVIELPAGTVQNKTIMIGVTATFDVKLGSIE